MGQDCTLLTDCTHKLSASSAVMDVPFHFAFVLKPQKDPTMPTLQGEPIALAIREHQVNDSNLWRYRLLLAELHLWVDRFDADFGLYVPTPVIGVAALRYTTIAEYQLGRSDIGARTTITFNDRWIEVRPFADTLATLLHEYLHAWEEWHCGREKGGWYHSVAWREKMAEIGIIADDHGRHHRVALRFTAYLNRYGVPQLDTLLPDVLPGTVVTPPSKRRQMPKWTCACPGGRPARAILINAQCMDCGQLYCQAEH